jgi:hypothetical protein
MFTAIVEVVRKLRGFLVLTRKTNRIMAGQNHTAPPFMARPAMIPALLRMILSCHDSVSFHSITASPRFVPCPPTPQPDGFNLPRPFPWPPPGAKSPDKCSHPWIPPFPTTHRRGACMPGACRAPQPGPCPQFANLERRCHFKRRLSPRPQAPQSQNIAK